MKRADDSRKSLQTGYFEATVGLTSVTSNSGAFAVDCPDNFPAERIASSESTIVRFMKHAPVITWRVVV